MTRTNHSSEVVLVLGGGGIRGLAHIGVWRACERLGLCVRGIVGSSIGALVGAFAAAGFSADRMTAIAHRLRKRDVFDVDYRALLMRQHRARALYRGAGLARLLLAHLPARAFDALPVPFSCNAVDLLTGRAVTFGAGGVDAPLHDVIRASCALPGFFPPVRIGEWECVDGGVLDPLPLELARAHRPARVRAVGGLPVTFAADRTGPLVVAVRLDRLDPTRPIRTPATMFGLLDRADAIRSERTVEHALAAAADLPLVVVAPDVTMHGVFDLEGVATVIAAGEEAAQAALRELARPAAGAPRDGAATLRPNLTLPVAPPRRRPSDTRPVALPR